MSLLQSSDGRFLESVHRKQKHPLLVNKTYTKLGGNDSIAPLPAIIHFGGYKINEVHRQTLRLVNKSSRTQRMHVLNPTTKFFRVPPNMSRKSAVAPGMAEEITVEFRPNEWRYYYDSVRVHVEGENLLIPIHAYPVVNEVVFPKKIDFGLTPLGKLVRRRIKVQCKVPIQFEYNIKVTQPHPDIRISPLTGLIPADGHVDILVEFKPVNLTLASAEIEVNVSQFNFVPQKCVITGSCPAGMTREILIKQLEDEVRDEDPFAMTGVFDHHRQPEWASSQDETKSQEETKRSHSSPSSLSSSPVPAPTSSKKEKNMKRKMMKTTRKGRPEDHDLSRDEDETDASAKQKAVQISLTKQICESGLGASIGGGIVRMGETSTRQNSKLRDIYGPFESYAKEVKLPAGGIGSGSVRDAAGDYKRVMDRKKRMERINNNNNNNRAREERTNRARGRVAGGDSIDRTKRKKKKQKKMPNELKTMGERDNVEIDGISFPPNLDSVTTLNFVLMQEEGKMTTKQLQRAIDEQRLLREQNLRRERVARMQKDGDSNDTTPPDARMVGQPLDARSIIVDEVRASELERDEVEDPAARQRREMVFLQDLADLEQTEREREFKGQQECIGEVPLSAKDIEAIKMHREEVEKQRQRNIRDKARSHYETTVVGPSDAKPTRTIALAHALSAPNLKHEPSFDHYKNDMWETRARLLRRFADAASKVIVRNRVQRRLNAVKQKLRSVGVTDRASARSFIERDSRQAVGGGGSSSSSSSGNGSSSGNSNNNQQQRARIQPISFPYYNEVSASLARKPFQVPTPTNVFDVVTACPLQQPDEYALLNYTKLDEPCVSIYVGREATRELMTGAQEETIPIQCIDQLLEHRGFVEAAAKLRAKETGALAAATQAAGVDALSSSSSSSSSDTNASTSDTAPAAAAVAAAVGGGGGDLMGSQVGGDGTHRDTVPGGVAAAGVGGAAAAGGVAAAAAPALDDFTVPLPLAEDRWCAPVSTPPTAFLRPSGDIRVFVKLRSVTETSYEDMLRPFRRKRQVRRTREIHYADEIGSSCLSVLKHVPTLSMRWRQQTQPARCAADPLLMRDGAEARGMWDPEGVPSIMSGPLDDDELSDDSDDDDDEDLKEALAQQQVIPTMALARQAFQVSPSSGNDDDDETNVEKGDDEDALPPSEADSGNIEGERGALVSISRDRARLALAAEIREEEEFFNDLLSRQMQEVNAQLRHPHLKFDLGC